MHHRGRKGGSEWGRGRDDRRVGGNGRRQGNVLGARRRGEVSRCQAGQGRSEFGVLEEANQVGHGGLLEGGDGGGLEAQVRMEALGAPDEFGRGQ